MNEDPIDLSPLDPTADEEHFDGVVDSIMARSADALAARERSDVMREVVRWRRPTLVAAGIAAAVALFVLVQVPSADTAYAESSGLAEAVGVPDDLAPWLTADDVPTAAQLMIVLEDVEGR